METLVLFMMIGALGVLWGERALPKTKKTEFKRWDLNFKKELIKKHLRSK